MPYIRRSGSNFIEICSAIKENAAIDATERTVTLSSISVPDFKGSLLRVTIDLDIMQVQNEHAGTNYLAIPSYVKLQDSGGTWRTGISIPTGVLFVPATDLIHGNFIFSGAGDLKAYIKPNTTYNLAWGSCQAAFDTLDLVYLCVHMKLYFN